jgi:hypothetical protein
LKFRLRTAAEAVPSFLDHRKYPIVGGAAMISTCAATRISPMLAAADMEETILFYQSVLGFTPRLKSPEYSIQALWEHVEAFKNRYRIRDLFDREYGMTEFHIEDPSGCLVFVGEPTSKRN